MKNVFSLMLMELFMSVGGQVKISSKKLEDNYPKLALLIGIFPIMIFFGWAGIPLAIIYYMLISIVFQNKL